MKRLYIIGNGFDLYHGLKSSYWNFREYLLYHNNEVLRTLEMFNLNESNLWSDFEQGLADLDEDLMYEYYSDSLVSYADDNWSDRYHHEFQFFIEQDTWLMTYGVKKQFVSWILSLEMKCCKADTTIRNLFDYEADCFFLNFNYTRTLEKIYQISDNNILYIHNKAIDENSDLILGHAANNNSHNYGWNGDMRVEEAYDHITEYYKRTTKACSSLIGIHKSIFNEFSQLKEIYVLGHSLSSVDKPYFEEIVSKIHSKSVLWNVSYHSETEVNSHLKFLNNIGIRRELINIKKLSGMFP